MAFQKRTGPPTRSRRAPRKALAGRLTRLRNRPTLKQTQEAEATVAELQANGAVFRIGQTPDRGYFYTYDVDPSGNRKRCEEVVRQARLRPDPFWSLFRVAIWVAIHRKLWGLD